MKITRLHSNHDFSSDPSHHWWWDEDEDPIRDHYLPWVYRSAGHWMNDGDYWYPGMWSSDMKTNSSIIDGDEVYATVIRSILLQRHKNRPKRKIKFGPPTGSRSNRPRFFAYGDSYVMKVWEENG